MTLNRKKFELPYAGKTLAVEVSELAGQATSSVLGTYGDSAVLATVVMGTKDVSSDYFPLRVDYEERFYAVGKVLGSRFMRREGRPSEEAILSGRVIDRTIRPLFDHRIRREVQVVVTVLSLDPEDDLDFLALFTASTALAISEVPWNGPVAGVVLARKDGAFLVNPKNSELSAGFEFRSFVAGTKDRISMIELEGIDANEKSVVEGFTKAQKEIAALVEFQNSVVAKIGAKKTDVPVRELDEKIKNAVRETAYDPLKKAIFIRDKHEREMAVQEIKEKLEGKLESLEADAAAKSGAHHFFDALIDELVHEFAINEEKRIDGRKLDELRPLYAEVALLKRTHGSGFFMRGNTQALAVTTIAPPGSEQLIESIDFSGKRRFMLHYNFPPYSVGEVGMFRGPGRREIGHGALAEKALKNLIPTQEEFPYTVRVVSEILSSNGSSSMATVCAASLSMMDAGVPIKKPAAGIAMGLMSSEKGAKVLTDIQGYEDHYGDMDCKIAGTADGVTAMQMDVKITGLTVDILEKTLEQARKARLEILKTIQGCLPAPRKEISPLAPTIFKLKINPELIGLLIGPGGKTINGIIQKTGAMAIDINDDGLVFVAGADRAIAEAALKEVQAIVKEYAVGDIVEGKVVKLLEFGAIVEFDGGNDGMIHISEIKNGFVKKIDDVIKVGDAVRAKIIKVENGKIGLSIKALEAKK